MAGSAVPRASIQQAASPGWRQGGSAEPRRPSGPAGRGGRRPGSRSGSGARHSTAALPEFDRPEILEAELSGLALDCAAWGAPPADLPFPDPPPAGALAAAVALLSGLGALDGAGRITETGRRMAALGAQPRLAAMMLSADGPDQAALACELAALLEERDPIRDRDAPCDVTIRLSPPAGAEIDRGAVARIAQAARLYRRRLRVPADANADGDPAALIAAAFPDRIAQRRGEPGSFRLSGGGGARLPLGDPLSRSALLAVAAFDPKALRIRLAAPLDPAHLPDIVARQVTESVETAVDVAGLAVVARRRRRLGALVLEDRSETVPAAEAAALLARAVPVPSLPWTEAAEQFRARVRWLAELEPGWPDLSDAALDADRDWLEAALLGSRPLDLLGALRARLDWQQASRLDRELPTHLDLALGRASIDYRAATPVAEARAQAFYGMAEAPRLAGGRVPLRLALLSPAGRPVAVTSDLAGFWRGGWADVLRDMRGRYPKHAWPDQPWQ